MTLTLHAGAKAISFDALRTVPTPAPIEKHVPIPHAAIVESVRYALGYFGHEIVEEHHGLMPDGMRYFGVMTLRSDYGNYGDIVGLRNSHDKSFSIGIAFGSRVFVCDNMAFVGEHVIRRKHTSKAQRELPGLVHEIVEPLRAHRLGQRKKFLTYQQTPLSDATADHALLTMYREEVIGVRDVVEVLRQWERPEHDWGEKTAWRLFNAATFALAGKVANKPTVTVKLYDIIDHVVKTVH